MGIFNRSSYEGVLVAQAHPEILEHQHLPPETAHGHELLVQRYGDINTFERHRRSDGARIVPCFLNVSGDEQNKLLLEQLDLRLPEVDDEERVTVGAARRVLLAEWSLVTKHLVSRGPGKATRYGGLGCVPSLASWVGWRLGRKPVVGRASPVVIIGSERSEIGLPAAMEVLREGGGALDAVEAAVRRCEDNRADHYVGTGGLPNARGDVELDASLMIGSTRAFGAVAAVKGFPNPISIARAVLERLPQHCLLVGEGAELFAEENGFERAELLTPESRRMFRDALGPSSASVEGERTRATTGDENYRRSAVEIVDRLAPHDGPWGKINVIALDRSGQMCVGVSTSGYPWKYPGRVGDSALPGAGNYCDVRFGGAACTGRGEMSMRVVGARGIVADLARAVDPSQACRAMLADAATLEDSFAAELRALALTPDGRHGGAAGQPGSFYAVMYPSSTEPEVHPRIVL